MTNTTVLALVAGLLVILVIFAYNQLVKLKQNVQESWSAIDTELRRRYDLIPNLVETVKGYAAHEKGTLEAVIAARNTAVESKSSSPEVQAKNENMLTGALRQVFALSEAYPQLKANENFNALQKELGETEDRLSQARRFYNANVREMNNTTQMFPSSLVAALFGFKAAQYFEVEDAAARGPVSVKF